MINRKSNNKTIPHNSLLKHPATLKKIQENVDDLKKNNKNNKTNIDIKNIPEINFEIKDILKSFEIEYISDLEEKLEFFTDTNKLRLIKLIFKQFKGKLKIQKDNIPKITSFLKDTYNLNDKDIENKFKKINDKSFKELFYLSK